MSSCAEVFVLVEGPTEQRFVKQLLGPYTADRGKARKPMFALRPADGAIGTHQSNISQCCDDFRHLVPEIARRVGLERGTAGMRHRNGRLRTCALTEAHFPAPSRPGPACPDAFGKGDGRMSDR